jgi:hypothetical protein
MDSDGQKVRRIACSKGSGMTFTIESVGSRYIVNPSLFHFLESLTPIL